MKTALAWLFLVFALVPLSVAQGTFTQIDVPGSGYTELDGINAAGDMVGTYVDSAPHTHGFLLSSGIFTTIDHPGSIDTFLTSLNDVGQVVGYSTQPVLAPFRSDLVTQTFSDFKFPGANYTIPLGINNAGTIAGYITNEALNAGFTFDGSIYKRITLHGSNSTTVTGITDGGVLVGIARSTQMGIVTNFLFSRGKFQRLPLLSSYGGFVLGVNSSGNTIVGNDGQFGFVFHNNRFQQLLFPAGYGTTAIGVNGANTVVGHFLDSNQMTHGFMWTPTSVAAKH